MSVDGNLPTIDPALLTQVVRRALSDEMADVGTWTSTRLHGGMGEASGGIYRVAGIASARVGPQPWSFVLKVLHVPAIGTTFELKPVEGWNREVLTYQSGLLDDLPSGLAAPRCYAIVEQAGYVSLWLEDVHEEAGQRWSIARFGRAARHMGRLSGTYLTARPLPTYPWLQRHLLRCRAAQHGDFWTTFEQVRGTPAVRDWWPDDLGDRARRLWEQRQEMLARLDRLPQTLVHGDADRRNLFARRSPDGDETVAIDWAFTGIAALGEELVNLVIASTQWFQVDFSRLPELADECFAGYVAGLADVGWRGDPRLAQVGFLLAAAFRYGSLWEQWSRKSELEWYSRVTGQPIEVCLACWATVRRFTFDRLDKVHDSLEAV